MVTEEPLNKNSVSNVHLTTDR